LKMAQKPPLIQTEAGYWNESLSQLLRVRPKSDQCVQPVPGMSLVKVKQLVRLGAPVRTRNAGLCEGLQSRVLLYAVNSQAWAVDAAPMRERRAIERDGSCIFLGFSFAVFVFLYLDEKTKCLNVKETL